MKNAQTTHRAEFQKGVLLGRAKTQNGVQVLGLRLSQA